MQVRKKFPNKGVNRETKVSSKISLIKTNLIGIRVTSSFFVTQDPNFYRIGEQKSIPDPLLVLPREGMRDSPSLIGVETEAASEITRSSDEDNPVSRSLDLTSDIFNNLATLAKRETRGNNEERTEVYG